MKGFYKKTLIIFIAAIMFMFIVGDLIHVGDKNYTYVDYQILYDLDYPQAQLNNHTLREVFEDGNLIVNGDFSDGLNGWIQENATGTIVNGILEQTATAQNGQYRRPFEVIANDVYFHIVRYKSDHTSVLIRNPFGSNIATNGTSIWTLFSQKVSRATSSTFNVALQDVRTSGWTKQYLDYVLVINLTSLGIDTLTVSQMDYWYNIYTTLKGLEA